MEAATTEVSCTTGGNFHKTITPYTVVTICGGSSSGHVAAALLGSKPSLIVNLLTRRPQDFSKENIIKLDCEESRWAHKGTIVGKLHKITSDPSEVIPQSDIVLICIPAFAHHAILRAIASHAKKNVIVGSIFGQGGFHWAAQSAFENIKTNIDAVFCFQNIPWLCRVIQYGRSAKLFGIKETLWVAACPPKKRHAIARVMTRLFDMPSEAIPNFLTVALTPSNQIIHPGRLYGIFHGWDGQKWYKENELPKGFYSDMDDFSAQSIQNLDDDIQAIKKELTTRYPALDLSALLPIHARIIRNYGDGVEDKSSLKQVFRTNSAYSKFRTPVKTSPEGFQPDVSGRHFFEDIPYGLCLCKSVAQILEVPTPSIDLVIEWHQQWMGKKYIRDGKLTKELTDEMGVVQRYGIANADALVTSSSLPESFCDGDIIDDLIDSLAT